MIILTAFGLHNYGGSDEALEMCIAGSWAALFRDIGYDVSSEQLAKACPKSRSFGRYELHLARDCLTKVIAEIKQDKAEIVGIIMDHGHRGRQDHFVIVVMCGQDTTMIATKPLSSSVQALIPPGILQRK